MGRPTQQEIEDGIQALFESVSAGDGDWGGEQREWHLPRLRKALMMVIKAFPIQASMAIERAKSPYDG